MSDPRDELIEALNAERVEAALESDPPEEIGILQARLEDQDRTIADLTRQLQGQPRRQADVVARPAQDAILYGTGFMQDGQHVPLEDVCAQPKPVADAAQK